VATTNPIIVSLISPAGITALTTGALSVLGLLTQLRNTRLQSVARFRNLDERAKAVTFWQAWLVAQQQACSPEELEAAKAKVRMRLDELDADGGAVGLVSPPITSAVARALLIYPPRRKWTWIPRALFYLIMGGGLFYAVLGAGEILAGRTRPADDFTYAGALVILAVVTLTLRLAALLLDGDLSARHDARAATVREANP
jgi:hypothetical protein